MKSTFARTALIASVAAIVSACASMHGPTTHTLGVLTNKEGRTLYTFDKDSAGKSNCNGACAVKWPPFIVADPTLAGGAYSIVTREDGSKQWAYEGKPLYLYAADTKPGDRTGENMGGVWHTVAEPQRSTTNDLYSGGGGGGGY